MGEGGQSFAADVDGYAAILTRAAALGMTGTQAGGTYLWVTMAKGWRGGSWPPSGLRLLQPRFQPSP